MLALERATQISQAKQRFLGLKRQQSADASKLRTVWW